MSEPYNQNIPNNEEPLLVKDDLQMQENNLNEFWSVQIRLGFIRKVYGILTIQILLTALMCGFSVFIPSYLEFQKENMIIFWICFIASIISSLLIICVRSLSRSVPTNYILLTIFTLCEAYLVSVICGMSSPNIVLMAAIMTFAVVAALTIYAFTTKTDFTLYGSAIFIFGAIMFIFGLFLLFTDNPFLHILYSSLAVILFSFYLVYDTQLIVGKHENKLEVDDYIIGAIMIYTDIIGLFLQILDLLNRTR